VVRFKWAFQWLRSGSGRFATATAIKPRCHQGLNICRTLTYSSGIVGEDVAAFIQSGAVEAEWTADTVWGDSSFQPGQPPPCPPPSALPLAEDKDHELSYFVLFKRLSALVHSNSRESQRITFVVFLLSGFPNRWVEVNLFLWFARVKEIQGERCISERPAYFSPEKWTNQQNVLRRRKTVSLS